MKQKKKLFFQSYFKCIWSCSSRNKDKYSCPVCLQTFGFAVNLKKHIWFTHGSSGGDLRLRISHIVPVTVPLPSKLEKMAEKYEDMKCSICGKFCTNWKALENHMLSHTNENPYKCEVCGKGFKVIMFMGSYIW